MVTVGLEILHNRKWVCLPRTEDNYFLIGSPNKVKFPLRVRLTSVSGEQLESTIPELKNAVDITSSVQFSGFIKGKSHLHICNSFVVFTDCIIIRLFVFFISTFCSKRWNGTTVHSPPYYAAFTLCNTWISPWPRIKYQFPQPTPNWLERWWSRSRGRGFKSRHQRPFFDLGTPCFHRATKSGGNCRAEDFTLAL